jgi:hypothetical protein
MHYLQHQGRKYFNKNIGKKRIYLAARSSEKFVKLPDYTVSVPYNIIAFIVAAMGSSSSSDDY